MDQRIPEPVQPLLEKYFVLVNQHLPDWLSAFYVEGSIALGEFNARFSDVDFVAGLNRQADQSELDQLRRIHRTIEDDFPRWKLSGSYLQWVTLNQTEQGAERSLQYHDGVLRTDGHFEADSVTGWTLKYHGIPVLGPEPNVLTFTVNWDRLITWMHDNLNSYWARWARRPDRIAVMLSDWGIQWSVLGVLRQYYSFRENSITTKIKAGQYALKHVPARWHQLIREAIRIREGGQPSEYRFRVVRAVEAVQFLNDSIRTCNAGFDQASSRL